MQHADDNLTTWTRSSPIFTRTGCLVVGMLSWSPSPTWIDTIFLLAGSSSLYHFYAHYRLRFFLSRRSFLFVKLPVSFNTAAHIHVLRPLGRSTLAVLSNRNFPLLETCLPGAPSDFTGTLRGLYCRGATTVLKIVLELVNKHNLSLPFLAPLGSSWDLL